MSLLIQPKNQVSKRHRILQLPVIMNLGGISLGRSHITIFHQYACEARFIFTLQRKRPLAFGNHQTSLL